MNKFLTETYLRETLQKSAYTGKSLESNLVELSEKGTDISFDIFLSHSFSDKEVILGLYLELKRFGFTVYVDWIVDSDLDREDVNRDTANKIKRRMISSKSLIYAHSPNSQISKWMPWELGIMDGNGKKVAILPIIEGNDFKRQEYLKLYPYITFERSKRSDEKILWINESEKSYVTLKKWFEGEEPSVHDN